jgi:hypothetical protein
LGALPLGTASDGETYSFAVSCEYPTIVVIPTNNKKQKVFVIDPLSNGNDRQEMCQIPVGLVAAFQ